MAKSLSVIARKTRTIVVITLSTILLFECTYRVILRLAPNLLRHAAPRGLDYGDTWRSSGLAPGGSLKENFDAMVLGPYGNTVHWKNNAQGFRNDYDVTPEPGPGVVRLISIGDSFTAGCCRRGAAGRSRCTGGKGDDTSGQRAEFDKLASAQIAHGHGECSPV